MKIHNVDQKSVDWFYLRAGIPTASEFSNLVSPKKLQIKTGDGFETYLNTKLAEWWLGGPLPSTGSRSTEQGIVLEPEALARWIFANETKVQTAGFVTDDEGTVGCSPDGLIGEDNGLEFKCPAPQTHMRYLLDGCVPDEYVLQVQGELYVTERKVWTFVSYCRGFPDFQVQVGRDEKVLAVLDEALAEFTIKFENRKKRLLEINGGPSRARQQAQEAYELRQKEPVKFSWDQGAEPEEDLIP